MLTIGRLMFLAGIIVTAAAIGYALIMVFTAKGRKRRLEERMKEKY